MTPERYEQVFQICDDALQVEGDKRAAFLDRACDGRITECCRCRLLQRPESRSASRVRSGGAVSVQIDTVSLRSRSRRRSGLTAAALKATQA